MSKCPYSHASASETQVPRADSTGGLVGSSPTYQRADPAPPAAERQALAKSLAASRTEQGNVSTPDGSSPAPAACLTEADLQCPVCLRLLYQPMTLPCGHSFCAPCLQTAGVKGHLIGCPLCRTELHLQVLKDLRPSVLLSALVEKFLPEASAQRHSEALADHVDDCQRQALVRQLDFKVDIGPHGHHTVEVYMADGSNVPIPSGSRAPIGLYIAQVCASFPPGWTPGLVEACCSEEDGTEMCALTSRAPLGFTSLGDVASPTLAPGAPVRLRGLNATHLNGRLATCMTQNPSNHRWEVCLGQDEATVAIQEANLIAVPVTSLSIQVTIHMQPRLQVPTLSKELRLRHGETGRVEFYSDSLLRQYYDTAP